MQVERRKKLEHFNDPGHAHALTFSCFRQWPLLSSDRTRKWFLDSLKTACEKHQFNLKAFVIMPNHVHLVVVSEKDVYDIAKFLQSVKQPISMKAKKWLAENNKKWLNKLSYTNRYGQVRFRFWQQAGGYDRNIINKETLRKIIDYIHFNPVRKGLVKKPEDWKWSSFRWVEGLTRGSIFEI